MTIGGSDSSGGAGIAADLRTFAALDVRGALAITAVTAQNASRVSEIQVLPAAMVRAQIDRIVEESTPNAVKTGMLVNAEIVSCVAQAMRDHGLRNLVVDPVISATSGTRLLDDGGLEAMRRQLFPITEVLTPNLPETEILLGRYVSTLEERRAAALDLCKLGPRSVVVKGGHAATDATDIYCDGRATLDLPAIRAGNGMRGTGCIFASAIAAGLASGLNSNGAVWAAKKYVTRLIEAG
jgi:hydroxymethylpyrimidine/phosphomethylpyrimidine kinase